MMIRKGVVINLACPPCHRPTSHSHIKVRKVVMMRKMMVIVKSRMRMYFHEMVMTMRMQT